MLNKSLSYFDAGVDIDAGNTFVDNLKPFAKKTKREGVMGSIGGFGALFELPIDKYKNPVLVSGTDGVGTKLKLACEHSMNYGIGIDLVAMCVNDVIVSGAEPLFFLDYYATGKLDMSQAVDVVRGISDGCLQAGCSLIGGETAEMPLIYSKNKYDVAGFCVGIAEKSKIIDNHKVIEGDKLIGISSSGIHSNGYSLVHKLIERKNVLLDMPFSDGTFKEYLLKPTRIYVKTILDVIKRFDIHAISHITGGGLTENIPRVLPPYTQACIDLSSWEFPEIFSWLQSEGSIKQSEMLRTFNCGVGMILCVSKDDSREINLHLRSIGEEAWEIGYIRKGNSLTPSISYA